MFTTLDFWIQMLTAVIGTLGFSLIFRVKLKHLPFVAIGGLLTYFVYYSLEQIGWNLFLISFLGAVAGAIYSEFAARFRRAPVIVFVLPSMVPIIPGGALYRTMDALINERYDSLFNNLGGTVSIGLGMAGGIVAVSVLAAVIVGITEQLKEKKKAS
ncbi:MAG: threonine/serine exporter family protein [Clostridia bacterium]|nr:threonine/serine exporter family protein [Clostridia bacterium]